VNVRRVFDRDHPSSVVVRPYPALSAEIGCQIGCQMCAAGRGAVTKLPVLWEWRHRNAGKVERNLPKVEVAGSIPVSRSVLYSKSACSGVSFRPRSRPPAKPVEPSKTLNILDFRIRIRRIAVSTVPIAPTTRATPCSATALFGPPARW
jgi:hypothetical protein